MAEVELRTMAEDVCLGRADQERLRFVLREMAQRGEGVEDVISFLRPFQRATVKVPTRHETVLDMCGTGGANFRTFNVSTIAALLVSAAGIPVAKHGNRSSNGICGSADLMEALGVRVEMGPEQAGSILNDIGFTFLFAPSFNPAMKNASSVRRELGHRTIFNILGPLLNPVIAKRRHLIGVYDERLLDILPQVLMELGVERALVVYGHPGMDEVSTLGHTKVAEVLRNGIIKYEILAKVLGTGTPDAREIAELPPDEAAETAIRILGGEKGPRSDMVAVNAAFGMYVYGAVPDLKRGLHEARRLLESRKGLEQLERFRRSTQG